MKREIKFRGKCIIPGEWLYGYLVKLEGSRYSILPGIAEIPGNKCMSDYEVHNATIGQFTGLKDKNGNDVWEGDLIRTFEGDIMVVEWDNGCLVTKCLKPAREGRINTIRNAYFCGEVIGNIHDNPEVLLRR